jgi:phenylacetate-CoA ligase
VLSKNRLYGFLPLHLQNVAVSLFGYNWQQRRFGGCFQKELVGFKNREHFDSRRWAGYQNEVLSDILAHSFKYVPYYQASFRRHGVGLRNISNCETQDLSVLPFLEKHDLREFGKTSLLSTLPEKRGAFFSSSGSTGTPTQILFSHSMHQRWSAGFEARIRHWAGVDRFTPRGMIGGRRVVREGNSKPPFYRYNYFEKQTYFSAYHVSAANAVDYLKGMRKYGARYMSGYAMSNFFLARFFQELNLNAPELDAVITSSEKLTPAMRATFQNVYNCKTYDSWSGVEACGLVSECEHGSLHISPDMGIIELLDENDKPVKAGEVGEVVCTGLLNFDQPLIRYRVGDMMRLGNKPCPCGRNMPVIAEIIGRVEDTVIGKDGREMVRFHGVFVDMPNVFEGQIVQHDLNTFHVNVVTNDRFSKEEEMIIKNRMTSQLGDVEVHVDRVRHIARNRNGKFKAVISHVKRAPVRQD